jgi:hypothetical protein
MLLNVYKFSLIYNNKVRTVYPFIILTLKNNFVYDDFLNCLLFLKTYIGNEGAKYNCKK